MCLDYNGYNRLYPGLACFDLGHWVSATNMIELLIKWDKVFKNGQSEICGRQPLKNLK